MTLVQLLLNTLVSGKKLYPAKTASKQTQQPPINLNQQTTPTESTKIT